MPKALDGKFYGTIFRHKDNKIEPPDSWIVFVARDNALPATLEFYRQECERLGCEPAQLEAIQQLSDKVAAWRKAHQYEVKNADVQAGELAW